MENLYISLFDDIAHDNPTDAQDIGFDIIRTIYGHTDLSSVSKYYNIENYNLYTTALAKDYLNILHINIRSFQKNFDNLISFIKCFPKPPDIIAVTETWLKESTQHLYQLDGYVSHHIYRTTREHGGVTFFINNDYHAELIQDFTFVNDDLEICTIKLKSTTPNYVISVIYRPNSKHIAVQEFTNIFNDILSQDLFKTNNTILLGDFNINLLEHATHQPTNLFLNTMQSLNYFPHISRPTRFPDGPNLGQPSLLDHIWSNFTPPSSSGIIHCPLSDHLPVFLNITQLSSNCTKHKITYRLFDNHKHNLFTSSLATLNWDDLLCSDDVNENFEIFIDTLNNLHNKHFPKVTKFISTKRLLNPWISSGILTSIKHKCNLFKMYKQGTISHFVYKQYRNLLTFLIRTAKQNYYNQIFCSFRNNTKKIWKTINEMRGKKRLKTKITTLNHNNLILDKPEDIAEAFNEHFSNIAPKLNSKLPPATRNPCEYMQGNYAGSMLILPVTVNDTKNVIRSLKNKKSNLNEISVSILKRNVEQIAYPLTLLFNQSIRSGKFPSILKNAKITPIHKSGPKNDTNNYRPISILSIFSKVLELLMKISLTKYLENKNILSNSQFGFRSGLSTFDALNLFSSDLFSSLDKSLSVLAVFVDFSKAFDTVNHSILLDKLYHYGIRGPIHSWFRDYLANRTQETVYDGHKSSQRIMSLGVPQGSVLGPILFLIYINDITNIFNQAQTILFADDMTIYVTGSNLETLTHTVNLELEKLNHWCLSNRLTINVNKTCFMLFSNKKINLSPLLKINNSIIKRTNQLKFLGVMYDDKLTFKFHTQNLAKKMSRFTAMLNQLRDFMPCEILKCLYHAHIYPLLLYCNPIWSTTYATHLNCLNIQLKKIIRIITKSGYLEHTSPLFKNTQILKLQDINKSVIATYMYINQINTPLEPVHDYPTRQRHLLRPPAHEHMLFRRSVMYLGPTIWNSIPPHIKTLSSINLFKKKFKQHILESY